MECDDSAGVPTGYIYSLISPGYGSYPCYARFRKVAAVTGVWIRGTGIEKVFNDDEFAALQWLRDLGCSNDRITICRPGIRP